MASKGQDSAISCENFSTGFFHYYPKNTTNYYTIIRTNKSELYIDNETKDTSKWEISWIDKCSYKLKYDKTNKGDTKKTRTFFKKHDIIQIIRGMTDEYYVLDSYIDKAEGKSINSDTIWLSKKIKPNNHILFEEVSDDPSVLNNTLTDTCRYALLHIYRPNHITLSLSYLPIYLNYMQACKANNNTGYIFKIFSPGPLEITSKQYNDTANTILDIKLGKIYYVKTSMNWAITKKLTNYRLKVENMDIAIGKEEFEKVRLNKNLKKD